MEPQRPGRFDLERAKALGIPEGPLFGQLQKGSPVTLSDGRTIQPSEVVGPPRRGRRIVVSGDTIPCQTTVDASRGADLLIHEATFGDDDLTTLLGLAKKGLKEIFALQEAAVKSYKI